MTTARDLADRFHREYLAADPFTATTKGIAGYDDRVPDDSETGDERRRAELRAALGEAHRIEGAGEVSSGDAVVLACVASAAEQELAELESGPVEYTVTAMPFSGPASFMAVAARTTIADARAAGDYVSRLRASGAWIDQISDRLGAGAAKGRLPVGPVVDQAVAWADALLTEDVPAPLAAPEVPEEWRPARDAAAREVVKPALRRWADTLRELRPLARGEEQAGLAHLPGGDADYARAVRVHTTLPLSAEELHRTGMEELQRLEDRCRELGAAIGLSDLAAIHRAMRDAAAAAAPAGAMAAAVAAVRRAEDRAGEVFPPPLPPPCEVTPMPDVVATSGMAPHYSAPKLDGSRPGTYWFNTQRPTAGAGWDVEGVAFHEAVPGHHLQLSRIQLLIDLTELQRHRSVTVFSEGWGLYAEQLAEEMGLYSGTEALLGAMANALMRACRLVVDTGMHAMGWSRQRAIDFFVGHVPMPEAFLVNEIDRYIIWPGQALAYLTGKLQIARLRDEARAALGAGFSLPAFHSAVLDHGSLPMPVLERVVRDWAGVA